MSAIITAYGVGKFVHVVAVLLAFGPTFGYPIFITVAEKTSPASIPSILRSILKADRLLVTPGMIVVLLAGIYLLSEGDISASESWVGIGFLAIFALFGMAHAFFAPQARKALDLAERDLASGDQLSAEYETVSQRIAMGGRIASLIVLVAVFFMVVKP